MNDPVISVVMSVYNGEKYIAEAIKSVLDQTFADFEFIVINDGSVDRTLEIIQEFLASDSRIVLRSRENRGLIASLNEGLAIAKGKYIARMDADDISLPLRFEKQFEFLEKNAEVGVCGTWVEVFGTGRKSRLWRMPISDKGLKPNLIFSVPFAHPTVMMRKAIIIRSGLKYNPDYKTAEDYKFWIDLSLHTRFANLPEVLVRHRYHNESVSRVADSSESDKRYRVISAIQSELLNNIDVSLSPEEQRRQFALCLNQRMIDENINLKELHKTFAFILKSNRSRPFFDKKSLYSSLARKYFIASVLSSKNGFPNNRLGYAMLKPMFFIGATLMIKDGIYSIAASGLDS